MAGVLHLWNESEVQILVLVSFVLQAFLMMFAGLRCCNMSRMGRILLWLVYLLADSTAIYTLGHMSISCKPAEHQQLLAFWAPFLLVHLGGQDTITAYAMEDNQLWLRHLLTLVVQTIGVAYVLYKYIARSETLVMAAAVLVFAVGIIKYAERVWALKSCNLDSINKLLGRVYIKESGPYYALKLRQLAEEGMDAEVVLQGAHGLLSICISQFASYPIIPSIFHHDSIALFYDKGSMYELIEMQLSLMHDIFYTKATVIHTWWGHCARAITLPATVMAFILFQFSTGNYSRIDATVTYVLLVGASLLEVASLLMILGSTWTCAWLRARRCGRLHSLLVSFRRRVKAAQIKRIWSGSIGQYNLVDSCSTPNKNSKISLWIHGSSKFSFQKQGSMISRGTKELVLKEIVRMVGSCEGKENVMRSYRGQDALKQLNGDSVEDLNLSSGIEFDEAIITWHFATHMFLLSKKADQQRAEPFVEAIKVLSNYIMFLLVEHPYMLPSPVRPQLYASFQEDWIRYIGPLPTNRYSLRSFFSEPVEKLPRALIPGASLMHKLLRMESKMPQVLNVAFGVWVEMLCYAAHHCSRDSHARHLNDGSGEFITIIWLMTTTAFHCFNFGDRFIEANVGRFFKSRWKRAEQREADSRGRRTDGPGMAIPGAPRKRRCACMPVPSGDRCFCTRRSSS